MEISNIIVFIGNHLEKEEKFGKSITELSIDKYIQSQDEVGRGIDLDEINEALGRLLYAGFIEIVGTDREEGNQYSRYIPKLKGERKCQNIFTNAANVEKSLV